MSNDVEKKRGRLAAGSWGRPGSPWQKQQSAKANRRAATEEIRTEIVETQEAPRTDLHISQILLLNGLRFP